MRGQRGPGHSLEVIYSFCGAQLEKLMNKLVIKSERTPTAVKAKLEEIGEKLSGWEKINGHRARTRKPQAYGDFSSLTEEENRLMSRLCKSMLKWVK